MNTRIARKILRRPVPSKRMRAKLDKMYPAYYNEQGHWVTPSWHKYHRFAKAWAIIHRKMNKYGCEFKKL